MVGTSLYKSFPLLLYCLMGLQLQHLVLYSFYNITFDVVSFQYAFTVVYCGQAPCLNLQLSFLL